MVARRLFAWMERRSLAVLSGALALTALLAIPMLALQPEAQASFDAGGPLFEARDLIDERLVPPLFSPAFLVEARDGDMLLRDPLLEFLESSTVLRDDTEVGPKLFAFDSARYDDRVVGVYTIADAVDKRLRDEGVEDGLAGATDDQVKVAVHELLQPGSSTAELAEFLSTQSTVEAREVDGRVIDYWVSPAYMYVLYADNEALGGGRFTATLGADEATLTKERYAREVQRLLRGDERTYQTWGVGIDANLTSEEEGARAGPYIAVTIIAVLIVVGVVLRSYWAVAVVGASLAALMVWLRGIVNLAGFEGSVVLDFIVPIAMISFGVDFAFHAIGRYREEAAHPGRRPATAFVAGLAGVSGALLLALTTDSLAFLSNVSSGIPGIVQFGLGAAVALVSAFVVLGALAPLALSRIEGRLGAPASASRSPLRVLRRAAAILAAALGSGMTVLLLVFFPPAGVVALAGYLALFLGVPLWVALRGTATAIATSPGAAPGGSWAPGGRAVQLAGRLRYAVVPAVLGVTVIAAWLAFDVEAAFDIEDFFAGDVDLVVAVEKIDAHSAAGEAAIVYVEGDLADPAALAAIRRFVERLDASDSGRFGRFANGELQVTTGLLEVVEKATGSVPAIAAIEAATGISIADADGDGLPDTREAVAAILTYAPVGGVPGETGMLVTPNEVPDVLWTSEDGAWLATQMTVGFPGSRDQDTVRAARRELEDIALELEADIEAIAPGARVQATGGPIIRDEELRATVRSLARSLPVAILLCLVAAAVFMRSVRYGVVATVPILLVVAWLYGFMSLAGYPLNIVTATIGAISIGVGIDYAIHFTMRYREELARLGRRDDALRVAGSGTGMALLASAMSSVIGFAVMAFAPMPMFATYGLLTAMMILFAASASLIVLPALLMSVTRDRPDAATAARTDREPSAAS